MIKTKKTLVGTSPLTLEAAKQWLRITDDPSADDSLITDLIEQSRDLIEENLNIAMVEYSVEIEATERTELTLPYRPIVSVTQVQDREMNDLTYSFNGFAISLNSPSDIVATYTCGYGSSELPSGLLLGWKEVLTGFYENRGDRMNTDFNPMILIRQNPVLAAYNKQSWWV